MCDLQYRPAVSADMSGCQGGGGTAESGLITHPLHCTASTASSALHCIYCTALGGHVCCTVLYCTVLSCTVLYHTVLYCTVLSCTILYSTVLYCTEPTDREAQPISGVPDSSSSEEAGPGND
jgi:hypothetical protein